MASNKATTININTKTTKAGNTYLYIVIYDERLADFQKSKYLWISTGMTDTPRNRRKLSKIKDRTGIEALNEFFDSHRNETIAPEKMLFTDYIWDWFERQREQIDEVTQRGYESYIRLHIAPYFEPKKLLLKDVTALHLEDYYGYQAKHGRSDSKRGGLSYFSLKKHKAVINQVFKDAVKRGILNSNPSQYVNPPKINRTDKEVQFYTVDEVKHLLELFDGRIMKDIIYITFMLGLRLSEVMGLRWEAIDFKNNTLKINHTIVANGSLIVAKDSTKTKSSNRQYVMPADVRNMLLALREKQTANKKLFGKKYIDTGYVFVKEDGSEYYPKYPQQELLKMIKREHLPHKTFHALRHGCVTAMLDRAQTMKDVSEWVGHSSIKITMDLYAHIDKKRKAETAKAMEGLLD